MTERGVREYSLEQCLHDFRYTMFDEMCFLEMVLVHIDFSVNEAAGKIRDLHAGELLFFVLQLSLPSPLHSGERGGRAGGAFIDGLMRDEASAVEIEALREDR